MHTARGVVRRANQLADLPPLCRPIHGEHLWTQGIVSPRLIDLIPDAMRFQRDGSAQKDLSSFRDYFKENTFCFFSALGDKSMNAIGFQCFDNALDLLVAGKFCE